MKPLDAVARGHVEQTAGTAGYAILEARVRLALQTEIAKLRTKGLDGRDADYRRGFADACEWFLRLPEEMVRGNSPVA